MKIEECYKIGYILKPHGLKGEVTVSLDPESHSDPQSLEIIFLETDARLIPYFVQKMSVSGDKAYIKFEEVDTQETARSISKKSLYLPKTKREVSARGEFYDDEIIGFLVLDESDEKIGIVVEVVKAGPNRLLSVDHQGKEVLIPVNAPFIKRVNKGKKRISVALPEGFLDL